MSNAMLDLTNSCGIQRQNTTRTRPQQNGGEERPNRRISARIPRMLSESDLSNFFSSRRRHTILSFYWSSDVCSSDLIVFVPSRRRHTRLSCDWSSDVCSSDLIFFFKAEDGIRDYRVTGVQTCALRSASLETGAEPREAPTEANGGGAAEE